GGGVCSTAMGVSGDIPGDFNGLSGRGKPDTAYSDNEFAPSYLSICSKISVFFCAFFMLQRVKERCMSRAGAV
ncbi:MAG: hypothetical protein V3S40_05535, partial [Kiloniellales bacterium]